jgi:hypothetical protein
MGKMNKYDKSLEMWNQYFLTEDILAPINFEKGWKTSCEVKSVYYG